jgi:hypothetical protein
VASYVGVCAADLGITDDQEQRTRKASWRLSTMLGAHWCRSKSREMWSLWIPRSTPGAESVLLTVHKGVSPANSGLPYAATSHASQGSRVLGVVVAPPTPRDCTS